MPQNHKPLILVSNDDGFQAPGVHCLTKLLSQFADVIAVCPETPQSGMAMAITVSRDLSIRKVDDFRDSEPEVEWYAVNGTPTDCVKLAHHVILRGRKPDLVCTGINHGTNAAINVVYSGTMGAAFEGTALGYPSIGFSLDDHSLDARFDAMFPLIDSLVKMALDGGLPEGVCLNVNAPVGPLKGMRLTTACRGHWSDEYSPVSESDGKIEYRLTGEFINDEPHNPDTDHAVMQAGYMSVVPCLLDRSAPVQMLPSWLLNL